MEIRRDTSSHCLVDFDNQLVRGRHLILTGNIADQLLVNGQYRTLDQFIDGYGQVEGYEVVIHYDIVDGLQLASPEMQPAFTKVLSRSSAAGETRGRTSDPQPRQSDPFAPAATATADAPTGAGDRDQASTTTSGSEQSATGVANDGLTKWYTPEDALPVIRRALGQAEIPVAAVINYADKLFSNPERQEDTERELAVLLKKMMQEAAFLQIGKLRGRRNALLLVAEHLGSIPSWLYRGNPFVAVLQLPRPDRRERACFVGRNFDNFHEGKTLSGKQREKVAEVLVDICDDLTAQDLATILRMSVAEQLSVQQPKRLVDYFRFGRIDDSWKDLDMAKLIEALPRLESTVRGQPHAVQAAVNVLINARGGLSTKTKSGRGSGQPKGVLWFGGATGVGKGELSRAMASLFFGDGEAYAKFDMSEYQSEHAKQGLIGAPPSYVGFEQGGRLTSRCLERPFSLFLFDEIEKAHHSVLDIFLSILDDGRLTDSKGQTAYFSKACLVFTSNVGGSTWNIQSTAPEDLPTYEQVRSHYQAAVESYFVNELGRPELLNRFGDNIVIFDILRPEFFPGICDLTLGHLATSAREEHEIELDFSDGRVVGMICDLMKDPKNFILGGRRIEKLIKTHVETPLNRLVAFREHRGRKKLVVSATADSPQILVDGRPVEGARQ